MSLIRILVKKLKNRIFIEKHIIVYLKIIRKYIFMYLNKKIFYFTSLIRIFLNTG